jgi:hypothetical protein
MPPKSLRGLARLDMVGESPGACNRLSTAPGTRLARATLDESPFLELRRARSAAFQFPSRAASTRPATVPGAAAGGAARALGVIAAVGAATGRATLAGGASVG